MSFMSFSTVPQTGIGYIHILSVPCIAQSKWKSLTVTDKVKEIFYGTRLPVLKTGLKYIICAKPEKSWYPKSSLFEIMHRHCRVKSQRISKHNGNCWWRHRTSSSCPDVNVYLTSGEPVWRADILLTAKRYELSIFLIYWQYFTFRDL